MYFDIMAIKTYSVTLEEEVVIRAKKIMVDSSQKLSPIINNLIKEWCNEQDIMKEENSDEEYEDEEDEEDGEYIRC